MHYDKDGIEIPSLRGLCDAILLRETRRVTNGKLDEYSPPDSFILKCFARHFELVGQAEGRTLDPILSYEEMVDYARWYLSDESVLGSGEPHPN